MSLNASAFEAIVTAQNDQDPFSGVILVQENGETVFGQGYGYANRSDSIPNTIRTRFGMASGSKIFTAVAVCQLVERGKIAFDTPLKDCLSVEFPGYDPGITVHHLLTHSSGIHDYFDEEIMEEHEYELLWHKLPNTLVRTPRDVLPLFQDRGMKFPPEVPPGQRFHYNNAGFLVLGLIVEQQSGMGFSDYVAQHVFAPAGMTDSGYFSLDRLPERCASGYIQDEDGSWRTNIYAIPATGMPDGGAFVTAPDMATFWAALFEHRLLSPETTALLLKPHIDAQNKRFKQRYGYGVWMTQEDETIVEYYVMGGDPGVAMISGVLPRQNRLFVVLGNTESPTWPLDARLRELLVA